MAEETSTQKRLKHNSVLEKAARKAAVARAKFIANLDSVFTHFAEQDGDAPGTPSSPARQNKQRKTEAEEDEELLKAADEEVESHPRIESSPPWVKGGTMRDYQVAGLNWLVNCYHNGINPILADEMGLGKTLQTISMLGYLKAELNSSGPHMVIVPNSTLGNWMKELERWCPQLKAVLLHGNKEERALIKQEQLQSGRFEVCVTSYEMVLIELSHLKKFHWECLAIDEAHRIKNVNSKLSQAVRVLRCNFRLLITGTPLQNNLQELWALLNFLMPGLFESSDRFDGWFSDAVASNNQDTIHRLHMLLKPFLLRRVKADVETALLPKKEIKVFVGLSKLQGEMYHKILMKDLEALNSMGKSASRTRLMNIAMQLRKVCNHPYLFDGIEEGPPYVEGEHLVRACGKLLVLDKLLKKLKAKGSRVLIFSQMTRALDILEDYMNLRAWQYCRLDGSTATLEREESIEAFNAPDSDKFAFLLSTRAGGLGINLATADTVVLYDSDWNPQMDLQAMDRAHRIGQKKQVMVYRMVTSDSIEEKITERAERKLYLDALVIQKGRLVDKHKNASNDELQDMIKFGASAVFSGATGTVTDADIDDILALSEQRTEELGRKVKSANLSLANFSLAAEEGSLYEHQGQDYAELQREQTRKRLANWIEPPERQAKVEVAQAVKKKKRQRQRKRPANQPTVYPWHFAPAELLQLLDKETKAFRERQALQRWKEDNARVPNFAEEVQKRERALAPELSEAERQRQQQLWDELPFKEVRRDEFSAFKRGMEAHGRDSIEDVAREMQLPVDLVRRFHAHFWAHAAQFPGIEALESRLKHAERRAKQQKQMRDALQSAMDAAAQRGPHALPTVAIGRTLSGWTQLADSWLVAAVHQAGYGNWPGVRKQMRSDPRIRSNWYLLSRSDADMQARLDTLMRALLREQQRGSDQQILSSSVPRKKKKAAAAASAKSDAPKRKGDKLPPAPTRGRSAYNYFNQAYSAKLKEENSTLSFAERSKVISSKWKELSAEEKKPYEQQAADDKLRFAREKAEWEAKTGQKLQTKKRKKKTAKKEDSKDEAAPMEKFVQKKQE